MKSPNKKLQIAKAKCGAENSWRDVTAYLQSKIKRNKLSVSISQPFREIGGDPIFGVRKRLIVNYKFEGKSRRLSLTEEYPVAFTIQIPRIVVSTS